MQSSELTEQLLRNDCDSENFHTFGYAKIFSGGVITIRF